MLELTGAPYGAECVVVRRLSQHIEAQRAAVARFAEPEGYMLTGEYTEVETGKGADALDRRPPLAAALAAGKTGKCPVIVAKLIVSLGVV